MALTYTPPGELGSILPNFSVKSVSGKSYSQDDISQKKGALFMFICNHCPYVKAIEDRLIELGDDFKDTQLDVFGVCSNDAADYPEDSFDNIKSRWQEKNYTFEYLYDETQKMAKDFGAVCTPDFFLFKNEGSEFQLYYRGRLDDSWKDSDAVQSPELKQAMEALLEGQSPPADQTPSMGCSIKWS